MGLSNKTKRRYHYKKNKKQGVKKQARNIEDAKIGVSKEVENSLLEKIISFGIESYLEIIEEEITDICGERYKHITGKKFTR